MSICVCGVEYVSIAAETRRHNGVVLRLGDNKAMLSDTSYEFRFIDFSENTYSHSTFPYLTLIP